MKEAKTEEGLERLARLEQKIFRTIELVQSARAEKDERKRGVSHLRRRLIEQDQLLRSVQGRLTRRKRGGESVRGRVQKLLEQVDSLASAGTEA